MYCIYKLSDTAVERCMEWDDAIRDGELVPVAEFKFYEDAVQEYDDGGYDPDMYCVGPDNQ